MAQWLSWLERRPVTAEVESSSLFWVVYGVLAQLGEHLPYKQRVIGSSPIGPIQYGWIPEWPKGADCKSVGNAFEGSNPSPSIERKKQVFLAQNQNGSNSSPFIRRKQLNECKLISEA